MLAEKYGWTPQEIDAIPELFMEQMMLVLNARLNVDSEIKMRQEHQSQGPKAGKSRQLTSRGSFRMPTGVDGIDRDSVPGARQLT